MGKGIVPLTGADSCASETLLPVDDTAVQIIRGLLQSGNIGSAHQADPGFGLRNRLLIIRVIWAPSFGRFHLIHGSEHGEIGRVDFLCGFSLQTVGDGLPGR